MAAELVADCPRCGVKKIGFMVTQEHRIHADESREMVFEAFCICRHCDKSTIFIVVESSDAHRDRLRMNGLLLTHEAINQFVNVLGYVSEKDNSAIEPPEHLPERISSSFREGSKCLAIGCPNAAATMFRLCIDIATRQMLPAENEQGLNAAVRRNLGSRLLWLFDTGRLPDGLRDLSSCVKEDGNDGAHEGTLSKEDAEDLLDFTEALLERLYTEPERLRLAKERRDVRRRAI